MIIISSVNASVFLAMLLNILYRIELNYPVRLLAMKCCEDLTSVSISVGLDPIKRWLRAISCCLSRYLSDI